MWEPWIGDHYTDRRTLILGESCYDWVNEQDGKTYEPQFDHPVMIVNEAISKPNEGSSTMKKLTRAICGVEAPSMEQAAEAWGRFAFTNYIPVSVGAGATRRPASKLWKLAEAEWPALLDRLHPKTVIVLGWTMWSHMPQTQKIVGDFVQGYELGDGLFAMCFALRHPSRGGPTWVEYADQIRQAQDFDPANLSKSN